MLVAKSYITISGAKEVVDLLDSTEKEILKAQVNAINKTATRVRREDQVVPLKAATGIKRKILNERFKIRRARLSKPYGAIRPTRWGIPVADYTHRFEPVDGHRTRARVFVAWPSGSGWKLAAGFVNPLGKRQEPLRSYDWQGNNRVGRIDPPEPAIGLSAAALAIEINTPAKLRSAADLLQAITDSELVKQYRKRG